MVWLGIYFALAGLVAIAVSVIAERVREPGVPAPDARGLLVVIAGLLWPVLIVGVLQFAAIAALKSRLSARVPAHAEPAPRTLVGSAA